MSTINPIQRREKGGKERSVDVTPGAAASEAVAEPSEPEVGSMHTIDANDATSDIEDAPSEIAAAGESIGKRWWLLAAVSALILTVLTVAGVYLVTKKPSTVDQFVILTVPSGADIKLDSKDYGHSPVKLEQLTIGTYTLTISKEGFEPIEEPLTVTESDKREFKLKPVPPADAAGLPPEEAIKRYQQQAEEVFGRGYYGIPYDGSALYYADQILGIDPNNGFAAEMRERIRKTAHQSAQGAIVRGDLGQAQEVYNFLVEYYPSDEEAKAAAAKLENQLSRALGQVRDLVRKADEALQAGRLTEPLNKSAYFYSKQALAIDRQNDRARQIRNQVKETLAGAGDQAYARGDIDAAIKQFEQISQLFPEDKQARLRMREYQAKRGAEVSKAVDPDTHRRRGLDEYLHENFRDAIADLEIAVNNGRNSPDVLFALGRSYQKIGRFDRAEAYFRQISPSSDDSYRSSIAALGEIAFQRGDSTSAVARWKEARKLGGSTMYSVATLDDKIEGIEKKQREKAAEPSPLTITVKHLHGGLLGGSCTGTLTINATGVRYDGGEHVYASNLVGTGVGQRNDELTITFQKTSQKFRCARADADRVRETISRYQQTYSPSN
jgi:tetratricopeptide (TPR) repeat protein